MEIVATIKDFITHNFLIGDVSKKLDPDTSLLAEGIIDSTGIIELVEFIQKTFAIKVEDEELIPDNLDSLANIDKFVQAKRNGAGN
ncbi:MAG: acyl carrier protein [Candidatus Omnitrophica bacterium]|nr:acyl carrier protein [Candidatus Omnitrophota bacterium]